MNHISAFVSVTVKVDHKLIWLPLREAFEKLLFEHSGVLQAEAVARSPEANAACAQVSCQQGWDKRVRLVGGQAAGGRSWLESNKQN